MKKSLALFFLFFAIIIVCLGLVITKELGPLGSNKTTKKFLISKGTNTRNIANSLYSRKIIKNPLAFRIYVQLIGFSNKIQAGEYKLSESSSIPELVKQILKGPVEIWVTIPEGLRREEVAEKFIVGFELNESEKEDFKSQFLKSSNKLEGKLFPDTYLFQKNTSASVVVNKMNDNFNKKLKTLLDKKVNKEGVNLNQALVLASILERETKSKEEKPIVAGILLKRLKAGWPLQVDASVQYAKSSLKCSSQNVKCEWWPTLTKEDIELNSPYNTYKYRGFPPTPLANPGTVSLETAIYPTDSPYWFYIHDSEGRIHYAESIEKHNQNIRNFL